MNSRRQIAWLALGLLSGALVVLICYSIFVTNDAATSAKDAALSARHGATANKRLLHAVEDCTTPGGACYKESRSQRRDTVININEVTVAASVCAMSIAPKAAEMSTDQLYGEIRACVRDQVTGVSVHH